jgi:hypothetical protein
MASGIQDAGLRWDKDVTSPFTKLTRRVYPKTIRETFAWAEELWMHHGMYSQSISSAVRYFMTELDVEGDDLDFRTRKTYLDAISENFDMIEELAVIGDDFMAFGNSFTSIHRPFLRLLICPSCSMRAPLKQFKQGLRFENCKFHAECPSCSYKGTMPHEDSLLPKEKAKPVITRWPPQFMRIQQHPMSKRTKYSIDLKQYDALSAPVRRGDLVFLEDTPWEVIEAICRGSEFEFADDEIYHMSFPVAACSIPNLKGWGLPPFMADFETAVLVTMLDKYVETILVEYLMPFRVFSPPSAGGTKDPMLNMNMKDFVGSVMGMIQRHRRNPTDWNFLPYPLEYQTLGGEAKSLIPVDIMEHFEMRLLHSMGIPPEFYKSSITGFQAAAGPLIGFKMFERTWQHFANQLNKWATWVVNKQGDMLSWETVRAFVKPVSLYEDPEVRGLKIQLAAAGKISEDTAMQTIGIDYEQERKKLLDQEEAHAEDMEERQRQMENQMANVQATTVPGPGQQVLMQEEQAAMAAQGQAGDPAAQGAAPMPPSQPSGAIGGATGVGATIDDLLTNADQIAQELVVSDPLTRRRTLSDLKHQDEALYAQVKARLSELENQAATQGVQLARQGQVPVQ